MKTTLAVIFLGLITFTFADYPKLTECKHPEAMKDFDSNKFLTESWHVTNAKHGSNLTVCREYSSKTEGGQQVFAGDGYYTFR
uniref:Putative salivary lipocalin n=1 Tax=Panstrongylus lignarius TaxID=156445 RepID=A0A224XSJ8_9HEMI